MKKSALCIVASLLMGGTFMPLPAAAQEALEEIIVTAQRRAEDLQSVPVAVTAFSPEELDQLGINDPQAMADFVPNVSIGDGTGRANVGAQYSIRGVNEARISPVLDPAVGIYIDDVYYGRPITNFLRLLDVARVEVLRGPQGTLFGKNSTGGAVRYVTVKPDVEGGVTGYLKLGAGEFSRASVQAAVNLPLSETVAARFAVASLERDGWLKRLSDGVGLGADDTEFYTGKLRVQPSDRLTIDLAADFTKATSNGGASKLIDYFGFNGGYDDPSTPGIEGDTTAPIFTGGISNLASYNIIFPAGTPEHYAPVIPPSLYELAGSGPIGSTRSESTGISLNVSYDVSESLTIQSITGYRTVDTNENRESDESAYAQSFFDGITRNTVDFWSQEFQLTGEAFGGFMNYVAGAYYSVEEPGRDEFSNRDYRATIHFGTLQELAHAQQETTSAGAFFQTDLALTDTVTLTLGIRYSEDDKSFSTYNTGVFDHDLDRRLFELHAIDKDGPDADSNYRDVDPRGGPNRLYINGDGDTYGRCAQANPCFLDIRDNIVASAAEAAVSGGDTFSSTTPRIALEWQALDGLMLYSAASKGFKAGGTNDLVDDVDTPFQPEELWSYEIGARYQSPEGRLRANVTAFTMDYTDKQITVTTSPLCNRRCTTNVGDAEISGIEIEAVALLTENLRFNMGLGTLDAEWTDIKNLSAGVESDSFFSRAPDLSYNAGLRHTLNLRDGASVVSSVNYAYKDEQDSSPQDSTTLRIPEYELLTARIGYVSAAGDWEVSLFCTNCLDEEYITGGAAWAGSTDGSGFNFKPSDHPAYVDAGNPDIPELNPAGNAPPAITLVNIGASRLFGIDFNYSF